MVIGMAEFLTKVGKQKKTIDKINMLGANDTFALRVILQAIYDDSVRFLLPAGTPPFKVQELADQEHVLHKEAKNIQYYVEGFHPNLSQSKREMMFVQLLERVTTEDAALLCDMKDKKPIKGITIKHVMEALPGLIQNNTQEEHVE